MFFIFHVLKTRDKFQTNRMLFTIRFINLFFMHIFRLKKIKI